MNKALMFGGPANEYTSVSALSCARECLADRLCQAFALYRNVNPAGDGINCRRYNELSVIMYDETSVTFFTYNSSLPLP